MNTPNLDLPYILPSQAQKHVTHNEAIDRLDAAVQLTVLDRTLTVPPGSPAAGERHIVAAGATAAWTGHAHHVAHFLDGGWEFLVPREGWRAWSVADGLELVFAGGLWKPAVAAQVAPGAETARLGINATPVAPTRLAVRAPSTLLDHEGAGHRVAVNKHATADTASLIFQKGYSGRAEIGLCGDDGFQLKVSTDGTTFREAIRIDHATGAVQFPATNPVFDCAFNLLADAGRFCGAPASGITAGAFAFPATFAATNSSTIAAHGKFIHNNDTNGGSAGALTADVSALVNLIRNAGYRRYGVEFWVAQITQGSGTGAPIVVGGTTYYEALFSAQRARLPNMTFHAYVRALDQSIAIRQWDGQKIWVDGVLQAGSAAITPAQGWASVTIHDSIAPEAGFGYVPATFDVYGRAAGDRWLFAAPALMPGLTRVPDKIGVVAAFNNWS